MTTIRKTKGVNTSYFQKEEVLSQLRNSLTLVEAGIKTYEEKLQDWKEKVIGEFSEAVEKYHPDNGKFQMSNFEPPVQSKMCNDYRVGNISRGIQRIQAMTPYPDGSIVLRNDDFVWEYIGYGNCI